MTDEARFLRKKNWRPEFGLNGSKSDPRLGFLPFSQVWFISFTCFLVNAGDWKLVPGPFMTLLKLQYSEIWPFLIVHFYHF